MKKAILQTLSYADVFDYPLSASEVWRFLISQNAKRKTQNEIKKELTTNSFLVSRITYHDGFYSLKGREEIFAIRKKREKWSQEKQKLAEKVAEILRKIPWIKMIGITGALAMENSDKEDDIDLLIATRRNRLWLTRLLTVFLVELVARRRRPRDRDVRDKICLNMFLDENHLAVPKNEQDLFSSHEVCQMRPLWDKDETYQKFLRENQWSRKFLPNWKP